MKQAITIFSLGLLLGACDAKERPIGHWEGYTSEQARGTSSSRVEVHITKVDEYGAFLGTVLFGEPGELPPASDPDQGYPEGVVGRDRNDSPPTFVEHFSYSLRGYYLEDDRLLVGSRDEHEVWTDWCQMQTSYIESDDTDYGCLPNCGGSRDPAGEVCLLSEACDNLPGAQIECGKFILCTSLNGVCTCDESGCSVRIKRALTFELTLDENQLTGQFAQLGDGFLTRQ